MEFQSTPKTGDSYFGAQKAEECAGILLNKSRTFYNVMETNFYIGKLNNMWRAYHGMFSDGFVSAGHTVNFSGDMGELVQIPVNHFRNLAQHILVMVTSTRPVMQTRAINTDYKSYAQTILGDGILDYYMREKGLEDALKKAVELSIVLGSGYIKLAWNATAGDIYDEDPDTGEPAYEGELEFSTLTPLDIVVDGTKENWDNDWILTRSYKNRFDLIAKYPELEDKIRRIASKSDMSISRLAIFSNDETDDIPVYEFFHKKTESMPNGRYLLFLSDDCVLLDAPMPYKVIPVFRIAPSDILGTPYGYTPMFDIFPIQEAINSLYSTILTNQNAFGVQNIWMQKGGDMDVNSMAGGLNVIESNTEPKPLNLTQTPAEVFKFLDMLIQSAETISGVNSVARGDPGASLKSGTALALVQSQALQFMSGLQQSYVKIIENVGTSVIEILKDFSTAPKMIALVGKNNRPLLKEFTGDQIDSINRVVVDMGNPLARSTAGRVQMAEQMLQMNIIKNPQQYLQVINTGRIDSMYEGEMSELLLIKSENEKLLDGINPLVSPMDKHSMHINEHGTVLSDPDLREDPNLVRIVMDHIQGHMDALRNTDPSLLQMIGETPIPPIGGIPPNNPGDQGQPPQDSTQNAPMGDVMAPVPGMAVPEGGPMQGPGVQNVNLPKLPQVDANLLSNPALQEQSMGNVRQE